MTAFRELAPNKGYLEGLSRGVLRFMRCGGCTSAFFYPRIVCPRCGSKEVEWHDSAGRGTVYSTTVIGEGVDAYNVSLIDLDEGFRLMSTVVDAVGTPQIGAPVQCEVEEGSEKKSPRVVFRNREDAR